MKLFPLIILASYSSCPVFAQEYLGEYCGIPGAPYKSYCNSQGIVDRVVIDGDTFRAGYPHTQFDASYIFMRNGYFQFDTSENENVYLGNRAVFFGPYIEFGPGELSIEIDMKVRYRQQFDRDVIRPNGIPVAVWTAYPPLDAKLFEIYLTSNNGRDLLGAKQEINRENYFSCEDGFEEFIATKYIDVNSRKFWCQFDTEHKYPDDQNPYNDPKVVKYKYAVNLYDYTQDIEVVLRDVHPNLFRGWDAGYLHGGYIDIDIRKIVFTHIAEY